MIEADTKLLHTDHTLFKIRVGPSGIHLFNRITGINILLDEVVLPSSKWSLAPRQVSIALTNACDLRCFHCYAPKSPAMLDFEQLKKWLIELDESGCVGVGFGGGEPTLYPKLPELCSFVVRETNLAAIVTTHAHRLSGKLLEKLSGNIHFIRVSMDGVGSTYEYFRGRSFNKLLERITDISKRIKFGINYLVNSRTINDLDEALNIAMNLGASEILLIPEVAVRKGRAIDNASLKKLKNWVNTYQGSVRLAISRRDAEGFPTCNPFYNELDLSGFAHIDATGILKTTSYHTRGIRIDDSGVLAALSNLEIMEKENM